MDEVTVQEITALAVTVAGAAVTWWAGSEARARIKAGRWGKAYAIVERAVVEVMESYVASRKQAKRALGESPKLTQTERAEARSQARKLIYRDADVHRVNVDKELGPLGVDGAIRKAVVELSKG